tara:strand:+ start:324 stop:506 length:183 start_codon:yes stop_codon:yes gene_type:complete
VAFNLLLIKEIITMKAGIKVPMYSNEFLYVFPIVWTTFVLIYLEIMLAGMKALAYRDEKR